jgi:hypothetical protein|tara:strand:- start:731 stop:1069 length:339 start_codon:yes stop_codon:yes gene_type:complete
MISTSDIFDAAKRNDDIWSLQYLGNGLYLLLMENEHYDGVLPQKMNSYGVLKTIDPTWYGMQYAPRNLTKEMADGIEAADAQYDEQNWEEIESDDGHRELYDDLDMADTVLE